MFLDFVLMKKYMYIYCYYKEYWISIVLMFIDKIINFFNWYNIFISK